ncbi:thiamine pyrophosphate-dependent enzyme [Roseomonas sp. 18066]|uniref:thiamine pyrophosphate-dependent enzyme n=1 Tax=Roseomonas sp. 18066 TaxID=2681412 RepID=UPI001F1DA04E|nr:thiamine pyrophosphate-dependent enzyme [Roseomonas sp. 18066]
MARLLRDRGEAVVITGLGSATYDLAAAGDHDRNFYLWGAMGGAAMVGLGLALARPEVPVLVLTGDGEMLMGMGGFSTIALQAPRNLVVAVLDNGLYGETGGQPSHTGGSHGAARTDLLAVARACGIAEARHVADEADLDALAARLRDGGEGPCVALIPIDPAEAERVLPLRDAVLMRGRTRAALGLSPGV